MIKNLRFYNTTNVNKNPDAAKPVYFEKIVRHMLATGVETFIEVGPGNTLSGFVKRTDKTAAVYNVSDAQTLEATLAALNKGD